MKVSFFLFSTIGLLILQNSLTILGNDEENDVANSSESIKVEGSSAPTVDRKDEPVSSDTQPIQEEQPITVSDIRTMSDEQANMLKDEEHENAADTTVVSEIIKSNITDQDALNDSTTDNQPSFTTQQETTVSKQTNEVNTATTKKNASSKQFPNYFLCILSLFILVKI
jgi:hypothetical protein